MMSEERYSYSDDIESIVDMKDSTDGLGIELTTSDVVLRLNQLEAENEAWKRCADAFNEATAGVTIGKMAHEHERQLLEAFRQYALLTREKPETPISDIPITP